MCGTSTTYTRYYATGGGGGGLIVPGSRQSGGGGAHGGGGNEAGGTISSTDSAGKGGGGGGWGAVGGNSASALGGAAGLAIQSEYLIGNPTVTNNGSIFGAQQSNNIVLSEFMTTDIDLSNIFLSGFKITKSGGGVNPAITYPDGQVDLLTTADNVEDHSFLS